MSKPIRWKWHTTQADRHVLLDHKSTAIAEATLCGTTEADKATMAAAPLMMEAVEALTYSEDAPNPWHGSNIVDEALAAIETIQALREEESDGI